MDTMTGSATGGMLDNIRNRMPPYVNKGNIMKLGIVALVVGVIYMIYKHIKDTVTNRPYLVKGEHNGTEYLKVPGTRIRPSKIGYEFTYSFWIYVNDWGHNFNKPKHIFHVGDENGRRVTPGVWLYPKTNNLMVRVDTYANKERNMNPTNNMNAVKKERPCDLVNIPVQRWMHVAVVMINKTIDIYLNGKLTRSCTLENVPKMNKGYVHICQNGGFSGKLCDLFYFNQAYSPGKIYSIYNSGPNSFDAYRYLDKFIAANKPKINLKLNVSADVGGQKVGVGAGVGN